MIGGRRRTGREVVVFAKRARASKGQLALLVLPLIALNGCATFGTNVKGSFSCAAPDGICAPSSVIDDRALAMISGDQPAMTPAGPFQREQGVIGPSLASADAIARTGPKILKIVFPSYVDPQGRFHEASIVRAVVDNGAWVAATAERGPIVAGAERLRIDQPSPAVELAYAGSGATAAAPPPSFSPRDLPSPEAVAAARELARPPATRPAAPLVAVTPGAKPVAPLTRASIAADVSKALTSTTPRNRPTAFSGKVED